MGSRLEPDRETKAKPEKCSPKGSERECSTEQHTEHRSQAEKVFSPPLLILPVTFATFLFFDSFAPSPATREEKTGKKERRWQLEQELLQSQSVHIHNTH